MIENVMKKLNSHVLRINHGDDHNVFHGNGMNIFRFFFSFCTLYSSSYICRICDGDPDCVDGADENTTLHHCASPQPCGEGMFTCENGRCINKVMIESSEEEHPYI